MNEEFKKALDEMQRQGWLVQFSPERQSLNKGVLRRYHWVPQEVLDFVCETESVVSPDERAWFQSFPEFNGTSTAKYAWNEWEIFSLQSASESKDPKWAQRITAFWDRHFPIIMSVKSDYAYIAIEEGDMNCVIGAVPDFEEAGVIACDFGDLLRKVAANDHELQWFL
jgi:hypothetical protein